MSAWIYIHKPCRWWSCVVRSWGKIRSCPGKPRHLLPSVARALGQHKLAVLGIACNHIDFSGWWHIASHSVPAVKDNAFRLQRIKTHYFCVIWYSPVHLGWRQAKGERALCVWRRAPTFAFFQPGACQCVATWQSCPSAHRCHFTKPFFCLSSQTVVESKKGMLKWPWRTPPLPWMCLSAGRWQQSSLVAPVLPGSQKLVASGHRMAVPVAGGGLVEVISAWKKGEMWEGKRWIRISGSHLTYFIGIIKGTQGGT